MVRFLWGMRGFECESWLLVKRVDAVDVNSLILKCLKRHAKSHLILPRR